MEQEMTEQMTGRNTMTIREIRKALFDTGYDVTINSVEFTNKQARDFFYIFDNQDKILKVIHLDFSEILAIWIVE
jgi:hypothetical protein